jgi:hypothetical protein
MSQRGLFTFWGLGAFLLGALIFGLSKLSGRSRRPSYLR